MPDGSAETAVVSSVSVATSRRAPSAPRPRRNLAGGQRRGPAQVDRELRHRREPVPLVLGEGARTTFSTRPAAREGSGIGQAGVDDL